MVALGRRACCPGGIFQASAGTWVPGDAAESPVPAPAHVAWKTQIEHAKHKELV